MQEIFGGEDAWKFHERLLTEYGGVAKIHGVLNVRAQIRLAGDADIPRAMDRNLNYTYQILWRCIISLQRIHLTKIRFLCRSSATLAIRCCLLIIQSVSFVPNVWGPSFSGVSGALQRTFTLILDSKTAGNHHKKQRKMLSPVFSIQQMRGLVPVFYPIAHKVSDLSARRPCANFSLMCLLVP